MEVRANSGAALQDIPRLVDLLSGEAYLHTAVLSLVVGDPGARVRKLPTLYIGPTPVFAHRDLDVVKSKLSGVLRTITRSREESHYLLAPCRLGEQYGLYCRDLFNRAIFRNELTKAGMEFSDDLFVEALEGSRFKSETWHEFECSFVILPGEPTEAGPIEVVSVGESIYLLGCHRLGGQSPSEIRRLVSFASETLMIRGLEVGPLISFLRSHA